MQGITSQSKKNQSSGFALGIDSDLNGNIIGLSYSKQLSSLNDGSDSDTDIVSLYGSTIFADKLQFSSSVGIGQSLINNNIKASLLTGNLNTSYKINITSNTYLIPKVGISYTKTNTADEALVRRDFVSGFLLGTNVHKNSYSLIPEMHYDYDLIKQNGKTIPNHMFGTSLNVAGRNSILGVSYNYSKYNSSHLGALKLKISL